MSLRPAGRDDPNVLAALGVRNKQHLAPIQAEQVYPFLAVILALVDPLDGKRITAGKGGLLETHSVLDEVSGSLVRVPLEAGHIYWSSVVFASVQPVGMVAAPTDLPLPPCARALGRGTVSADFVLGGNDG